jgi:hypothetical protein
VRAFERARPLPTERNMPSFIHTQINRTNRNLLLVSLVLFGIFAVVVFFSARYLRNLAAGPRPISVSELAAIKDPSTIDRYYVTVTAEDVLNTGIELVTTSRRRGVESKSTDAGFYLIKVGDNVLLLEQADAEDTSGKLTFNGTLEQIPADEQRDILNYLFLRTPELKERTLPFKLDARPYASGGHYVLMAFTAIAGVLGLTGSVLALLRMTDPSRHPLMKRLATLGDAPALAQDADNSLTGAPKGPLVVSERWLVHPTFFDAEITRIQDLTWVHATRKQKKSGNVVISETGSVILHDRGGERIEVDYGKNLGAVAQLTDDLNRRAPWAVHGHSPELEEKWEKERESFIQWIDQRRAEHQRVGAI